ncbi:MAG: hypothetical protein WC518_01850 [Patescibacteria group bacterium]
MGIELNFDLASVWESFVIFASQDPITIGIQLFLKGGWVIFLIVILTVFYDAWLDARQGQYAGKWQHVLLAIDIPKNNEQTPKAVENLFVALAGTQSSGNLIDRYWHGKIQESFSFEIVSLEGYIQFLVRTPVHFRDLVEAAVYAQYPEAEITEVEDYAKDYAGLRFPNEQYNLWGTELVLTKDYPYPIKTYIDFEHTLTGNFLDPMAGLLEILSRFGPGEQLWLQLVVTPWKPDWGEKAKKAIKTLKGENYAPPTTIADRIAKPIEWLGTQALNVANEFAGGGGEGASKKEEDQWKMFKLTPGERLVFEKIQHKLSKIPFRVKFRMIYLAKKDVFAKGRGVAAVIGNIQQFNVSDANGFKPGPKTKTAVDYFRVKKRLAERQKRILRRFIGRSNFYGEPVSNMFLSTEELATLWHFPVMTVKAPRLEMIGSRRAVPPTRLPYKSRGFTVEKERVRTLAERDGRIEEKIEGSLESHPRSPKLPAVAPLVRPANLTDKSTEPPPRRNPEPPANLPTV